MRLVPSASQTVGPFFNFALTGNPCLGVLAREGALGKRITLTFRVLDGNGDPTPGDSMIEIWQADAQGSYESADLNFSGFGRLETTVNGECVFETIKPGALPDGQAPHINVIVFARGLLKHLNTRVYFPDSAANSTDAVLSLVPESRRSTLFAKPSGAPNAWTFEVRLQGENETVFFDV